MLGSGVGTAVGHIIFQISVLVCLMHSGAVFVTTHTQPILHEELHGEVLQITTAVAGIETM